MRDVWKNASEKGCLWVCEYERESVNFGLHSFSQIFYETFLSLICTIYSFHQTQFNNYCSPSFCTLLKIFNFAAKIFWGKERFFDFSTRNFRPVFKIYLSSLITLQTTLLSFSPFACTLPCILSPFLPIHRHTPSLHEEILSRLGLKGLVQGGSFGEFG